MTLMAGVTEQKLTLVQVCALMDVGYRQSKRTWKRYQADGDAGLVHRLRGQPSGRGKAGELRTQALALYADLTGRKPAPFRQFEGKVTIAAVPPVT